MSAFRLCVSVSQNLTRCRCPRNIYQRRNFKKKQARRARATELRNAVTTPGWTTRKKAKKNRRNGRWDTKKGSRKRNNWRHGVKDESSSESAEDVDLTEEQKQAIAAEKKRNREHAFRHLLSPKKAAAARSPIDAAAKRSGGLRKQGREGTQADQMGPDEGTNALEGSEERDVEEKSSRPGVIATAVGVNKHEFVLLMQTIWRRHRLTNERLAKERAALKEDAGYGHGQSLYRSEDAPEFIKLDKREFTTMFALMLASSHRTFLDWATFGQFFVFDRCEPSGDVEPTSRLCQYKELKELSLSTPPTDANLAVLDQSAEETNAALGRPTKSKKKEHVPGARAEGTIIRVIAIPRPRGRGSDEYARAKEANNVAALLYTCLRVASGARSLTNLL